MRYKTVRDVIEFVGSLKAKETADSLLQIHVELYHEDAFAGEIERAMCSYRTVTVLKDERLLDYFVTDFKIEIRDYCVAFVLNIKEPSNI